MTLTTERLKWLHDAATELSATKLKMTMRPDEFLVLTSELLANREAQPVGFRYRNKDTVSWLYNDWRWPDSVEAKQCQIEWLYTAPPAPACPEMLPCPVHLLPGLKFGKGVPTRSMLDALVRRAEYEAELDAMTPERKAEDDARIEAFKALLPAPPAPAVPAVPEGWEPCSSEWIERNGPCSCGDAPRIAFGPTGNHYHPHIHYNQQPTPAVTGELLDAMDEVIRISDREHDAWARAKEAITACRASMLAAAPEGGNG